MAINKPEYDFNWLLLVLVVLCMVFARNAAMSFNRYVDRAIDKANPRTQNRELPKNMLNPKAALWFAIINSLLFIATTFFINPLCFYLSPIALIILLGYSYTKHWTMLCHLILGLGLSLSPIGAYIAVTGSFDLIPILLSLAVLFWVGGFDVIYALQDFVFDKNNNLKSIPVKVGKKNALAISMIFHFISIAMVILIGILQGFGLIYFIGCLLFSSLLIYEHTLINPNNLSKINKAFFTSNSMASVVYALFVLAELYFN